MVKMTIKEAANSLLEKGVISQEECEHIKEAAAGTPALSLGKKIVNIAQPTAVTLGLGALGYGLIKDILTPVIQKAQAGIAFKRMAEKVPALREKDPEQVKDYFNVIQTFSPKAATNPLVAGALVNKMMEFGGVDHKLVQDISAIQTGVEQSSALQDLRGAAAKSVFNDGGSRVVSETTTQQSPDISTKTYQYE